MSSHAGFWLLRRWRRARTYLIPLLFGAAICLPALFGEKWISDSSFYTAISLKAVRDGHWWTLHMSSGPYFNKPPLAFWVHAACLRLFGVHNWAVKLPEYASVLVTIALTVRIARAFSPARAAMGAGIALACTYPFVLLVDSFRLDYLHTMFVLAAAACVAIGWKRARVGKRGSGRALVTLAGVPIGLAMLTKPMWGAVVLFALAAWLLLAGGREGRRLALWVPAAFLLAAAVAVPWHWSMVSLHGDEFINTYFRKQTIARAKGDDFGVEPWWWYFREYAQNYRVLGVLAAMGLVRVLRGRAQMRDAAGTAFLLGWVVVMLLLLSAFPDKKRYYNYHVYPFLGWLAALWVSTILPRRWWRVLDRGAPWVAATLFAAAVAVVPAASTRLNPTPDLWKRTYAWIRNNREDVERSGLYNASLLYNESARVYVFTGVWPLAGDWNNEQPIEPPPGALVMFDSENRYHRGRRPRPGDETVFSVDRIAIVRRK